MSTLGCWRLECGKYRINDCVSLKRPLLTLTTVTSTVSLFPVFISQSTISKGGVVSWLALMIFVPTSVRKSWHNPSTDVPGGMRRFSSKIVILAQDAPSMAWFGQQSMEAGSFGGATLRDGSSNRQSPLGMHGGDRHVSCNAGTHTSCSSHSVDEEFLRRQFGRPHQILEHFGWPLKQMQELQLASSVVFGGVLSSASELYGDNVVELRHTEAGSDRTDDREWHFRHRLEKISTTKKNLRISHRLPLRPGGQIHENPPMPSWHVAPPKHGCGEHSFTLIRQSGPENPCAHKQRNQPGPDSHVPPLWHGWPWHWSNGSEQNGPPHPFVQRHCDVSPPTADDVIHEPPFRHWPDKHCVTLSVHFLPATTQQRKKKQNLQFKNYAPVSEVL